MSRVCVNDFHNAVATASDAKLLRFYEDLSRFRGLFSRHSFRSCPHCVRTGVAARWRRGGIDRPKPMRPVGNLPLGRKRKHCVQREGNSTCSDGGTPTSGNVTGARSSLARRAASRCARPASATRRLRRRDGPMLHARPDTGKPQGLKGHSPLRRRHGQPRTSLPVRQFWPMGGIARRRGGRRAPPEWRD